MVDGTILEVTKAGHVIRMYTCCHEVKKVVDVLMLIGAAMDLEGAHIWRVALVRRPFRECDEDEVADGERNVINIIIGSEVHIGVFGLVGSGLV